ncbi:hypothetical protein IAT38_006292 [Cryptococcus sp. DSM 104549]
MALDFADVVWKVLALKSKVKYRSDDSLQDRLCDWEWALQEDRKDTAHVKVLDGFLKLAVIAKVPIITAYLCPFLNQEWMDFIYEDMDLDRTDSPRTILSELCLRYILEAPSPSAPPPSNPGPGFNRLSAVPACLRDTFEKRKVEGHRLGIAAWDAEKELKAYNCLSLPTPEAPEGVEDKEAWLAQWVLDWWKMNEHQLPTLARMAKDYLSAPSLVELENTRNAEAGASNSSSRGETPAAESSSSAQAGGREAESATQESPGGERKRKRGPDSDG